MLVYTKSRVAVPSFLFLFTIGAVTGVVVTFLMFLRLTRFFWLFTLSSTGESKESSAGRGGETTRHGLCEQPRLTVIPPVITLVVDVLGRRRHGQQHEVMIRRTLQLPASSCMVGTGQEESRGPQQAGISTQVGSTCNEEEIPNQPCV
jgi:hypothetical protein